MTCLLLVLGLTAPASAQEPQAPEEPEAVETVETVETVEVVDVTEVEDDFYGEAYPVLDRAFEVHNGRLLRQGTWGVVITHRNSAPIRREPFHEFLGFDGGSLKIALGVRYGLLDGFDLGVLRMNGTVEPFDTYELDGRLRLLERQSHGVDLALRGGVSWFSNEDNNAAGYFAQLLGSTVVAERLTVGAAVLHHSDSTNEKKTRDDDKASVALAGLLEARLGDWWAVDLEAAANVAGYHSTIPIFTFGPKIITNRHTFSFILTNSQYMGADGIVANTPRAPKRWILGFNIIREI